MDERAPASSATLAEYFEVERSSSVRHEFRGGRIIAMAGASEGHVLIVGNTQGLLWSRLRGSKCRSYANELRVHSTSRESGYCYPDIAVVCGPSEYDPASAGAGLQTITNPRVVLEVLSPSTEADDRGDKFDGYREIPSFEQYVLVSQHQPYVMTITRQPGGGWLMMPYQGLDAVVPLASIGVELPLADVYAGVVFVAKPLS